MGNVRLRRLQNDHSELQKLPRLTADRVQFTTEGDPPTRYIVTYKVKGLVGREPDKLREQTRFDVEFQLTDEYPRMAPVVTARQKVWHPNFWRNQKVCIDAEHFAAGQSLTDLVIRVGEMIQYQVINLGDPANRDAAEWAAKNEHLFPIDKETLQCGAPPEDDDIVIRFGRDDDDAGGEDDFQVSIGSITRGEDT